MSFYDFTTLEKNQVLIHTLKVKRQYNTEIGNKNNTDISTR